jgi:hypothetical protein
MLDHGGLVGGLVERLDQVAHGFAYGYPDFQVFGQSNPKWGKWMIVPPLVAAQTLRYSVDRLDQEERPQMLQGAEEEGATPRINPVIRSSTP